MYEGEVEYLTIPDVGTSADDILGHKGTSAVAAVGAVINLAVSDQGLTTCSVLAITRHEYVVPGRRPISEYWVSETIVSRNAL
jgi:hypothetical protein